MFEPALYAMLYLGALLMVYNVYGFVRFDRYVRSLQSWDGGRAILRIPIILLSFFLFGYIGVALFGKPDLLVAGILFGGSIFVFIMHKLLFGIVSKVVEIERLETQLRAAESASEEKTVFLSTMSHEMRTPLNVILGLDGIMLKRSDLVPEVREDLERINLAARHLLALIHNILNINDIESGRLQVKHDEFSLDAMVEQVVAIAGTVAEQKGLSFEADVDEGAGGKYLGDEMELKQVLLSLLDNAVKYTDAPGRVRFAVSALATTEVRRVISFVVSDTGIGMDEEFLTKVFGVFAREDASSTSRHGGGGLSLAVAKRMVDQMGGSIHADSKKGEGSIFTITLPLDVVEGPEVVEDTESIEDAEGEPEELLEGYRILIAEDIDENAEIVMDLLDLEGAETERAENGAIAVDMFSSSEVGYYDAILMDLRMPVMDGLEATRRIRALEREDAARIPIVALTANAFESDMRQTEAAGMNAHMAKPADADLMYRTLRQLIQATPA